MTLIARRVYGRCARRGAGTARVPTSPIAWRSSIPARRRSGLRERSAGAITRVEQARLAVGGGAERAHVARRDPVARRASRRRPRCRRRSRCTARWPLSTRGSSSPNSSSSRARRDVDARALAEPVEVEALPPGLAERARALAAPLLRRARGELLADHAQRQELVALQAQDRLEPRRRRPRRRAGSRPAFASASAAPDPRGSGSSRSRCPGTPA